MISYFVSCSSAFHVPLFFVSLLETPFLHSTRNTGHHSVQLEQLQEESNLTECVWPSLPLISDHSYSDSIVPGQWSYIGGVYTWPDSSYI